MNNQYYDLLIGIKTIVVLTIVIINNANYYQALLSVAKTGRRDNGQSLNMPITKNDG